MAPPRLGRAIGPRIFGIPAGNAPTVAVLRRGPSAWCQVGRWEPGRGTFEPGAWLRGTIYPQRCDLSPDGRWLASFTLKAGARWDVGSTYLAISRLPWLSALAAWGTCGTWTRGIHFVERRRTWELGDPAVGDVRPLRRRYGLAVTQPVTFAVERRHGWIESADTPAKTDLWDERRADRVTLEKPNPADPTLHLTVAGRHAAFRDMGPAWGTPRYGLVRDGRGEPLPDVQWADWDRAGRLLVATSTGALEIREAPFDAAAVTWTFDLAALRPDPREAPSEARQW